MGSGKSRVDLAFVIDLEARTRWNPFVYMQGSKYSKWGIDLRWGLKVAVACAHWQGRCHAPVVSPALYLHFQHSGVKSSSRLLTSCQIQDLLVGVQTQLLSRYGARLAPEIYHCNLHRSPISSRFGRSYTHRLCRFLLGLTTTQFPPTLACDKSGLFYGASSFTNQP